MEMLALFTRQAPNRVFFSILLGAVAGLSYATLIPIVLTSIQNPAVGSVGGELHTFLSFEVSNAGFAKLFGIMCLVILVSRSLSQILLSRVALDATTNLRIRAYGLIARAPIAELEKLGPSRLMAAITNDVQNIIMGATLAPALLIWSVTLTGMMTYLFLLSPKVFRFVSAALAFGVISYQVPMYVGRRYFERGRENVDLLFEAIRGLLYGAKELKLNQAKRDRYFSELLLTSEYSVRDNSKRGNTIITAAANYGDLLSFSVIGISTFIFINYFPLGQDRLLGVIMVLLYITGPVAALLNAIPQLSLAMVSLRRIRSLFEQLSRENAADDSRPITPWKILRFRDVQFQYDGSESNFSLGPVSFDVSKGEVVFIIGGNGSGKSTLGKLISLHYTPKAGQIYFGETKVTPESLNRCRESISAIFSDYYLFERLLDVNDERDETLANSLMKELGLEDKVQVRQGRFSTISLSDGQRKRLALLIAFLEDRELFVFDEWAADQDPTFKEVFYRRILPSLRAKKRAVVVISHDDRFFDTADTLVMMDEGKVTRIERRRQPAEIAAG
jgi:putative pyoverdin transport system ATP-binding/permease protein